MEERYDIISRIGTEIESDYAPDDIAQWRPHRIGCKKKQRDIWTHYEVRKYANFVWEYRLR